MATWQVQEAKTRLSEVIERAPNLGAANDHPSRRGPSDRAFDPGL